MVSQMSRGRTVLQQVHTVGLDTVLPATLQARFGMLVQPLRLLIVQLKQSLDPHIPWVGVCLWPKQNPTGEAE